MLESCGRIGFERDDWFDDSSLGWEIDFDEQIAISIAPAGLTVVDAVEWRGCRSEARLRSSPFIDIEALGPPRPPFLGAWMLSSSRNGLERSKDLLPGLTSALGLTTLIRLLVTLLSAGRVEETRL
jgi:hypothetical protein